MKPVELTTSKLLEIFSYFRPRVMQHVGAVIAHDAQNGTDLLHTLRTYLAMDRSGTQTAKILVIHRQTLMYRLKMIQRLTGINPNSTVGIVSFYEALSALEQSEPGYETETAVSS